MGDTERSTILRQAAHERSHPHPLRLRILCRLEAAGSRLGTEQLASDLDAPANRIHYHMLFLSRLGWVDVDTSGLAALRHP